MQGWSSTLIEQVEKVEAGGEEKVDRQGITREGK